MRNTRMRKVLTILMTLTCGSTAFQYGGCETSGYVESWDGMADPWYTTSIGLPESPPSYWESLGYGTQNVDSWGGLADSWYTSSLGLPAMW